MVIDKVGSIGPGYGPKKADTPSRVEKSSVKSDNVTISAEATRAAEGGRIAKLAKSADEPSRADKLKEIKEKLEKGEYDNISDDVLSNVSDNIVSQFLNS